jgi:hypothetical protein
MIQTRMTARSPYSSIAAKGYLSIMRDTLDAAEAVRIAAVRAVPPAGHLRNAIDLSDLAMRLAMTRIRAEHPDLDERQLIERLRDQARIAAGG